MGIGVGISEIYKHTHEQKFIPNQYTPQDSDIDLTQAQNLAKVVQRVGILILCSDNKCGIVAYCTL